MKGYFILLSAFLLIILSLALTKIDRKKEIISYKLNGKDYRLLVADSDSEYIKGLMKVKKLKKADGMIFVFQDKNYRIFWNKNTYLDLDIYWMQDDKVVGIDYLPSIKKSKQVISIVSPYKVNKVIELIKR